jgi:DNA modification methylase
VNLFDWQKVVVRWALGKGKAALFEGCGLGKTLQQLAWADEVSRHTKGDVLILAPLAVAEQTKREGEKFGIPVTLCRSQEDVRSGLNVTNYEMLEHFHTGAFAGIVLDESSILKAHDGRTRQYITDCFSRTPYRLACSATPAPNDHMELGTHAEFLGVMSRTEMLAMFFTHDGGDTSKWRLKGHAQSDFWKWVCSWAVMIQKPSDIGYRDDGYILPPLHRKQHVVKLAQNIDGMLFTPDRLTLEERREVRRKSLPDRVAKCAELVNKSTEQWLVWCDLNDESSALAAAIPDSVEVSGSDSREHKTRSAMDFVAGKIRVLVSKASIFGYGLNLQNCRNIAFVGLSDSFEQIYQAERRCWRFGQKQDVHIHVITSDGDGPVVRNIERKECDFEKMIDGMVKHMKGEMQKELQGTTQQKSAYREDSRTGEGWQVIQGDCVAHTSKMDDDSIDFTVFSPPFSSLYTYSNSDRDMGNSRDDDEFQQHFRFLVEELYRVTRPGRIVAFHCMNIPAMKERDGYIGIKDFRGDLIRVFQAVGFIYHSEHVIWKDPLVEATRTKAIGLMHKQLCKDSSISRSGLPDYLIAMRKPGDNTKPIRHPDGLTSFAGENPPKHGTLSHERWRRYASPVWMDIDQSNTLNGRAARESEDERHVCPLQLDVIERALELWSTDDDLVLSPFCGIGSEGYQAVKMGRRFVGIELKESYFNQAVMNLAAAETAGKEQHGLFEEVALEA